VSRRINWDDIDRALRSRAPATLGRQFSERAAVAMILRDGPLAIETLFVKRAEHPSDPWSGHMAFPGGRAEPQDVHLLATAMRETAEEIGIDLSTNAERLGALDEIQAMRRGAPTDLSITPFVFRLRAMPAIHLSDEIVSAHWAPLTTLIAPESRGSISIPDGAGGRELPCIRFDEQVIWGLTYRMFAGLASRLGVPGWETSPEAAAASAPPEDRE
jgi:8-oxo-dGTP pyrophosphatase MutT (NUDIX family)